MVFASAGLAFGCGGSSDGADPVVAPTTTVPTIGAGEGEVTLGGEAQRFTVESCVDGPGADDTPEATQQFRLTGSGTAAGLDFAVTATRYTSDTGVGQTTITETITITSGTDDEAVGIEAKRTQINGEWLDLNDPNAKAPLLQRTGSALTAEARFGPEGSVEGDPDITPGSFTANCL